MKTCNKCKEEKELSEFYKNKSKKDNLSTWCGACSNKYHKQYRQNNKEAIERYRKKHYQNNKEAIEGHRKKYYKKHYQNNKEAYAERAHLYYRENKEKYTEQKRAYTSANREKIAERHRLYNLNNREAILETERLWRKNQPAAVYEIRNKLNGKVYIGQSTTYPTRKAQHRGQLKKGTHGNKLLQLDYNKHGEDAFEYSMVREFQCDTPQEFLIEQESIEMAIRVQRGETLYNSQLPSTELLKCDLELLESAITEFEHPIDHLQMIIETCNSQNVPLQLGLLALKQIKERE